MSKFNYTALANILFIAFVYLVLDIFLFDYREIDDYTVATYIKLGLIAAYVFAFKSTLTDNFESSNDVKVGLEFSTVAFCVWFSLTDLFLLEGKPSMISGILLLFGLFWTFILLSTLPFELEKRTGSSLLKTISLIGSKLFMLTLLVCALSIFYNGSWVFKLGR